MWIYIFIYIYVYIYIDIIRIYIYIYIIYIYIYIYIHIHYEYVYMPYMWIYKYINQTPKVWQMAYGIWHFNPWELNLGTNKIHLKHKLYCASFSVTGEKSIF